MEVSFDDDHHWADESGEDLVLYECGDTKLLGWLGRNGFDTGKAFLQIGDLGDAILGLVKAEGEHGRHSERCARGISFRLNLKVFNGYPSTEEDSDEMETQPDVTHIGLELKIHTGTVANCHGWGECRRCEGIWEDTSEKKEEY